MLLVFGLPQPGEDGAQQQQQQGHAQPQPLRKGAGAVPVQPVAEGRKRAAQPHRQRLQEVPAQPGPRLPQPERHAQARAQHQQQDDLVEQRVAQPGEAHRPHVDREGAHGRGQVVAEAAQPANGARFLAARVGRCHGRQALRHLAHRARTLHPRHQPAAQVAAARHRAQVVEARQPAALGQGLHHAQAKRGAPDAAARKGQPQQLGAAGQRRRPRPRPKRGLHAGRGIELAAVGPGLLVEGGAAGGDVRQFMPQHVAEGHGGVGLVQQRRHQFGVVEQGRQAGGAPPGRVRRGVGRRGHRHRVWRGGQQAPGPVGLKRRERALGGQVLSGRGVLLGERGFVQQGAQQQRLKIQRKREVAAQLRVAVQGAPHLLAPRRRQTRLPIVQEAGQRGVFGQQRFGVQNSRRFALAAQAQQVAHHLVRLPHQQLPRGRGRGRGPARRGQQLQSAAAELGPGGAVQQPVAGRFAKSPHGAGERRLARRRGLRAGQPVLQQGEHRGGPGRNFAVNVHSRSALSGRDGRNGKYK